MMYLRIPVFLTREKGMKSTPQANECFGIIHKRREREREIHKQILCGEVVVRNSPLILKCGTRKTQCIDVLK